MKIDLSHHRDCFLKYPIFELKLASQGFWGLREHDNLLQGYIQWIFCGLILREREISLLLNKALTKTILNNEIQNKGEK